jgi:DNA (cytosine-5)-methyltransferase 1
VCVIDDPLHTVTSKPRFGLVMVDGVPHEIADIGMRMLQPRELYTAQGFPASYIIDRGADGRPLSKAAQVRMCGNSVCPPLAEALVRLGAAKPRSGRYAAPQGREAIEISPALAAALRGTQGAQG